MTKSTNVPFPTVCPQGHVSTTAAGGYRFIVEDGSSISGSRFSGSIPCAVCGQQARIVDGTYDFVDGTLRVLRPLGSRDDWLSVIDALEQLPDEGLDLSAAIEKLADQLPQRIKSAIQALPPPSPSESVAAWKTRLIALILTLLSCLAEGGGFAAAERLMDATFGNDRPTIVQVVPPESNYAPRKPVAPKQQKQDQRPRGEVHKKRINPVHGKPSGRGNGHRQNKRRSRQTKPPGDK